MDTTSALLAICRAWLHGGRASLGQVADWRGLRRLTAQHRLLTVVYRQLEAQAGELPAGELKWWTDTVRKITVQNFQATAELVKLLSALQAEGINPVPVKGPCMSLELYGDVSFREFADLDLLVPESQLPGCMAVLHKRGYLIQDDADRPPEPEHHWPAYLAARRGAIPLINQTSGIEVDLHWRMLSLNANAKTGWHQFISPEPLSVAGHKIPRLTEDILLVYLALHGFKHGWHRLAWLMDLAVLQLRSSNRDLAKMTRTFLGNRQNRLMYLSSLHLAESLLRVPLHKDFNQNRHYSGLIKPARELAAELAAQIYESQGVEPSHACLLKTQLMACPGLPSKVTCLMRVAGAVGFEEVRSLRLPRPVQFLYYPYRLFRLLRRTAA